MNGYMGQLQGPFKANEELISKVREAAYVSFQFVDHLGIQTKKDTMININGKSIQVGRTGTYEITNAEVTSFYFEQDTDEYSLVDYTIYTEEE